MNQSKNASSADNQQGRLFQAGWIVGFVDGEGCFSISIFKNRTSKYGWQILPEFVVTQSEDSLSVLEEMKNYFNCGHIFINKRYDNHRKHLYRYCVRKISDLDTIIIPFFNQYPLLTMKQNDFLLFSEVINLLKAKIHYSKEGLEIIAQMVNKKIEIEPSETTRQTRIKIQG